MKKRTPAQDFVRALDLLDEEVPVDKEDAVGTLREFGLEPEQVVREGRAAVARFDAARASEELRARPRRRWNRGWAIAAAIAVLGAAFASWRATMGGGTSESIADGTATAGAHGAPQAAKRVDPKDWKPSGSSLKDLAIPGGAPPLEPAPTDADGHLEVDVRAMGAPKQGAQVRLYLRGARDPSGCFFQWHLAGGGVTDARGKLRVPVGTGSYVLAVRAPGFAVARRDVSRPSTEELTKVTIQLDKGSVLRGRVVEAHSHAEVPLAQLTLARSGGTTAVVELPGSALDSPPEETSFAAADVRGRFEFPAQEAGEYRLVATADGHGQATRQLVLPRSSEELVELSSASNLEGYVFDGRGAPAAGAEVTVLFQTKEAKEMVRTTTGPRGGFAAEVPPGRCTLTARLGEATGAAETPVVLSVGQTVRGITIRLGTAGAIEGTVTDKSTHAPVDGALVALSPFGGYGDFGRATTADGGHFVVEPLAAGPYDLEVDADGYSELGRHGVTITAGQHFSLSLELEGNASASGTVKDAAGSPVADAVVQAGSRFGGPFIWGNAAPVRTAADGSYRLIGLPADMIRLQAGRNPGEWLTVERVELHAGQEAHVDLVLHDIGTLEGQVTLASGAPFSGDAVVRIFPAGAMLTPSDVRKAVVGADGHYTFDVPAGHYVMSARRPDDFPVPQTAPPTAVEAGQTVEANLTLADDSSSPVSGTVLEPNGLPSPLAFVTFTVSGRLPGVTRADASGHFQVDSFWNLPDVIDLTARNGGRTGRIQGVAKGTHDVTIALSEGGAIEGEVVGEPPPETVLVQVATLDDGLMPWLSGGPAEFLGSSFTLRDVPSAAVRVSVSTTDGRSGTSDVTVPADGVAQVTVQLQEGKGSISGRVVGPSGKPVKVVTVVTLDYGHPTQVSADGSFTLSGVTVGPHVLIAGGLGYAPLKTPINVSAGQTLDVGTLTLAPVPQH